MRTIKRTILFFVLLLLTFSLSAKSEESGITFEVDKSAKKIRIMDALDQRFIQEFDASGFEFTLFHRSAETGEFVPTSEFFPKIFVFSQGKQAALTSALDVSKVNKTFFFDAQNGHVINEINERVIAVLPDQKGFLSWDGKEIYRYASIDAREKTAVSSGEQFFPWRTKISPSAHFMAVEMCSCPGPICRSNLCLVKLFDLSTNREVKEFEEEANRGSRIVGEFDESGRYYYARNNEVFVDGKPFNGHKRFDLEKLVWESVDF